MTTNKELARNYFALVHTVYELPEKQRVEVCKNIRKNFLLMMRGEHLLQFGEKRETEDDNQA